MPSSSRIVFTRQVKSKPKKRMPRWLFRLLIASVLFAILIIGIRYVCTMPYLEIRDIQITGAEHTSAEQVANEARSELLGMRWFLFSRGNYLFLRTARIKSALQGHFPGASEVIVEKSFPRSLHITFRERTLWGVYCVYSQTETPHESTCYYLDTYGTAFERFSSIEGRLLPIVFAHEELIIRETGLESSIILLYDEAKRMLAGIDVAMLSLSLSSTTPGDATLETSEGWDIDISLEKPVGEWVEILKAVLVKEIAEKRTRLAYIDLRFGEKVFYKLR